MIYVSRHSSRCTPELEISLDDFLAASGVGMTPVCNEVAMVVLVRRRIFIVYIRTLRENTTWVISITWQYKGINGSIFSPTFVSDIHSQSLPFKNMFSITGFVLSLTLVLSLSGSDAHRFGRRFSVCRRTFLEKGFQGGQIRQVCHVPPHSSSKEEEIYVDDNVRFNITKIKKV